MHPPLRPAQTRHSSPRDSPRGRRGESRTDQEEATDADGRAVVLGGARTAIGRYGGSLSQIRTDDLLAFVLRAAVERVGIDPAAIEEIATGVVNVAHEGMGDIARWAALAAEFPNHVPAYSVNRFCGSSLTAAAKPRELHPRAGAGGPPNPKLPARDAYMSMIETAQKLATIYEIPRHEIDEFAVRSHRHAAAAMARGRLAQEIVPIDVPAGPGATRRFEHDEFIRPTRRSRRWPDSHRSRTRR